MKCARSTAVLALAAALSVSACRSKSKQCAELAAALQTAQDLRSDVPEHASKRGSYYNSLLRTKRKLEAVELSDDDLVKLQQAEARNLEEHVYALKELLGARVTSELTQAQDKFRRVSKRHVDNVRELNTQCGLIVRVKPSPEVPGATKAPAVTSAPAGGRTTALDKLYHHPTLPFEARFFGPPEIKQDESADFKLTSVMATDGRRTFAVHYLLLRSGIEKDCVAQMKQDVKGEARNGKCQVDSQTAPERANPPTLYANMVCATGVKYMIRTQCVQFPKGSSQWGKTLLFEAKALFLSGWDATEARRFADSAKLDLDKLLK